MGGQGVTLGVERHEGLARSSPWNNKYSDAVTTINALLKDIIGVENYRWSSVDIGKNTVLKPQTKVDHLGKTLTFLIGNFTGGRFRIVDNTCVLTEPNEILIYDASKPHLSEPHTGVRLSVTVYYHRLAHSLSLSEKTRLNSLGFHLDPIVQSTSSTMGTNQPVDPLTASP